MKTKNLAAIYRKKRNLAGVAEGEKGKGCMRGGPLAALFDLFYQLIKWGQELGQLWKIFFANGYRGFVSFGGWRGLDTVVLGCF
jgi:hypothetical protein